MTRPKRLGIADPKRELAAMRACRDAMVRIATRYRINGPEYRTAQAVMDALDDLAGALTGDRRALWSGRRD